MHVRAALRGSSSARLGAGCALLRERDAEHVVIRGAEVNAQALLHVLCRGPRHRRVSAHACRGPLRRAAAWRMRQLGRRLSGMRSVQTQAKEC